MKYRVRRRKPRAEEAKRVLVAELLSACEYLKKAKTEARSMHEARKHLKRARALLNLMLPSLGETARSESGKIRSSSRLLSRHRQADVLQRLLEKEGSRSAVATVQGIVPRRQSIGSPPAISRARDIATVRRTLIGMTRRLKSVDAIEIPRSEIEQRFRRSFKKARNACQCAAENGSEHLMHTWRKRSKRLLNQSRLLDSWGTSEFRMFKRELTKLDNRLGYARDCRILAARLRRQLETRSNENEIASLLVRLETKGSKLTDLALRDGAWLFEIAPRKFIQKMLR
jgi:CHAD domain-containing protein